MKIITAIVLCMFLFPLVLSVDNVSAKPKSYPLMCQGGGTMKTTLWNTGIKIQFRGGGQGAGVKPPRWGECTWLDRGFRPSEPRVLDWVGNVSQLSVTFVRGRINGMDIKGARDEMANCKYLYNKIRNGEIFQVHANQDTCGKVIKCPFLTVMEVGP